MSEAEELVRKAERHIGWRRALIVINALAYMCWVVTQGLLYGKTFIVNPDVLNLIRIVSLTIFLATCFAISWQMGYLKKNQRLEAVIDDERSERRKALSFKIGYIVLILGVIGLYFTSIFIEIDMRTAMPLLLGAGVTALCLASAFVHEG